MTIVNPMIFGHNFEITRSAAFGGIYSEKINNRKFCAKDENGVPEGFYRICTEQKIGLGQHTSQLYFPSGKEFKVRVWLQVDLDTTVFCDLKTADVYGMAADHQEFKLSGSRDMQLLEYNFCLDHALLNGCFEVTCQRPVTPVFQSFSIREADSFYGMRRDVLDLLKRLKPAFFRYPGGCYAEYFNWKNTLLPVDQRACVVTKELPFILSASYHNDTCEIGIDEFMQLCRYTGAEPQITVRVSDNVAQDAADLVEYCNGGPETHWGAIRIQRGFSAPFHVKVWYVGNELVAFGRNGLKDPHCACEAYKQFFAAMKAVDPTIKLLPSTGLNTQWDTAFYEGKPKYDLLTYHMYVKDRLPKDRTTNDLLRAPFGFLYDSMKAYHDLRKAPISLDEWNYCWGQSGSAMTAAYAAGVLHMLIKNQEKLEIRQAAYFEPVNEGAIQVTPYGAWMRPDGMVFELFSNHGGNVLDEENCLSGSVDLLTTIKKLSGGCVRIVTAINTDPDHSQPFYLPFKAKVLKGCLLTPENQNVFAEHLIRTDFQTMPAMLRPAEILYMELTE